MRPLHLVAGLIAMSLSFVAGAGDAGAKVKYVPPAGFAGHKWGEPRNAFTQLPAQPLNTGAAWMMPVITDMWMTCTYHCDFDDWQRNYMERREGGGFYVLTEYQVDGQGFQWGRDVEFFPVTYQFCANWWSSKRVKPANFDEINEFCGVRFQFQSETLAQLLDLPDDHVTTYDKVLAKLIARFGRPDGFTRRGSVLIQTDEPDPGLAKPLRKFHTYRWCPAFDRRLKPNCDGTVVLTLNPETGEGQLLYSAPMLWEYAYARQNNGHKGEPLFRVLHARR